MAAATEYGLTPEETRVLGSLLEKERLTPDVYPMTLNALVNACNQKSSREPVVEYGEAEVLKALDALRAKGLVRLASGEGRTQKYRHLLDEAQDLDDAPALAALTVLFLRGPQTAGEIRTRSGRMHEFASVEEVDQTLAALAERGFVQKLPRQPGSREHRFAHLFAGPIDVTAAAPEVVVPPAPAPGADQVAALAAEVEALRAELAALREEFARFRKQFE